MCASGRRWWLGALCAGLLVASLPARAVAQPAAVSGAPFSASGTLQIIHEDYADHGRYRYFLERGDGSRVPLIFRGKAPTNLLTGAALSVRGQVAGDSVMVAAGGLIPAATRAGLSRPAPSPTPAPPATLGAQTTLVILVNFQDAPSQQPFTAADANNAVFNEAGDFFLENSYRQTWLTGDVAGWFTIPETSATCDTAAIAADAQSAAAAAGFNLSAYAHFLYVFPQNDACGFAGSSFVGGNPSQSWLNGDALDPHIIAHELGHALGLWHSHLLDCGADAVVGSACSLDEYGDIVDTMGAAQSPSPHYNAFQKERLGWLNNASSPAIVTVQSDGTYSLDAWETAGTGPAALKILKSTDPATGAQTWYYVEARQALGFDAFLANEPAENVTDGVLVHIGTDGDGNSGALLDMTPATPTYYFWFDPALAVGQTFSDASSGVTLATTALTSTGATVTVHFQSALAVTTSQQMYAPGQTVSVIATATVGGAPAAKASVGFTIVKANGSIVKGTATTGSNGIATYNLKLRRSDPTGTYSVSAVATIKGAARNASATFSVQ